MKNIEIGTKIYYRGDMANMEGFGEVTSVMNDRFGSYFSAVLEDGREINKLPAHMLSEEDTGNGMTRFCTLAAFNERRELILADMYSRMAR
jgi:hypothetical protein